jgi:hypothetical protein
VTLDAIPYCIARYILVSLICWSSLDLQIYRLLITVLKLGIVPQFIFFIVGLLKQQGIPNLVLTSSLFVHETAAPYNIIHSHQPAIAS